MIEGIATKTGGCPTILRCAVHRKSYGTVVLWERTWWFKRNSKIHVYSTISCEWLFQISQKTQVFLAVSPLNRQFCFFWKSQCSRIRLYHFWVENSSKGDRPSKTGHYRTILLATIDVPWTEKLLSPWYFMKDVLAQKFSMTECRWKFWPSKSELLVGGRIKTKYPDGHSSA